MATTWGAWGLLLMAGFNSCIGNLLLKRARMGAGADLVDLLFSPWLLFGLAFHGANAFFFAKALGSLPVSVAYPALAGWGFILLTVSARVLFGERLGTGQWIGLAMILAGILVSARYQ